MRNIFFIVLATLLFAGCEKEVDFSCTVVESEVEAITETSVTLTAIVDATNYNEITRMGFAVRRSGSESYTYYDTNITRSIALTIEELRPNTTYNCLLFVHAAGDIWQLPLDNFKTLKQEEEPDPEPDPEPEPDPDPDPDPEPEPDPDPDPEPDPENPDEKPAEGRTYRVGWYELPIEVDNNADGCDDNIDSYYYAHHICTGGEQNAQRTASARNYSVCFSAEHHCPVWVAAPRHAMYEGSAKRTNAYTQDPQIPANIQYVRKDADSGCNNGHMLGSAERTSSTETNRQVFYFSNIAPQYQDTFNTGGGAWNRLEDHIDGLVCADTLYTVIGCYFDKFTDAYGTVASPAKISFGGRSDVSRPTMFYYALLRTKSGITGKSVAECSADELQCAAFVLSHEQSKGHTPEARDLITIEELERITGFTYFDNVPNAPKGTLNANDWL